MQSVILLDKCFLVHYHKLMSALNEKCLFPLYSNPKPCGYDNTAYHGIEGSNPEETCFLFEPEISLVQYVIQHKAGNGGTVVISDVYYRVIQRYKVRKDINVKEYCPSLRRLQDFLIST